MIKPFKLLCFLLPIFSITVCNADWVKTNGPEGGKILCFLFSGGKLLAGTNGGGIFRSSDEGEAWSPANSGMNEPFIPAMARNASAIFAATLGGGMFRSIDDGDSWKRINQGLTNLQVSCLALNGETIFAGTLGGGIFRSVDNGDTWIQANNGLFNKGIGPLICNRGALLAYTFDSTSNLPTIFRSMDNGSSWQALYQTKIDFFAENGKTAFYGFAGAFGDGGLFRSGDQGIGWKKIWSSVSFGFSQYGHPKSLEVQGNTLFLGTTYGEVFRSLDNGDVWTPLNAGLGESSVNALISKSDTVFAGTNLGAYRSINGGPWNPYNKGLTNVSVTSLESAGSTLFAATNDVANRAVYKTTDAGISWTRLTGLPDPVPNWNILATGKNLFFYGAGPEDRAVFRSSDFGITWTKVMKGIENEYGSTIVAAGGNLYLKTSNHILYRSNNAGDTWVSVDSKDVHGMVDYLFPAGDILFVSTDSARLVRTLDGGKSWLKGDAQFAYGSAINSISQIGGNLFMGLEQFGAYRSTDSGATWHPVNRGMANQAVRRFAAFGGGIVAATLNGAYFSKDNGDSWSEINQGLTGREIETFATIGDTLFAGIKSGGVWKLTIPELISGIHGKWGHGRNPGLAGTLDGAIHADGTIGFTVLHRGMVDLSLFDCNGRKTATLVHEILAPGAHNAVLTDAHQKHGIHFLQLISGDGAHTVRILPE